MKKQQNRGVREIEDLELETLNAILKGQKERVKNLYSMAERLFIKGSDYSRALIANRFVYPLSNTGDELQLGARIPEFIPATIEGRIFTTN